METEQSENSAAAAKAAPKTAEKPAADKPAAKASAPKRAHATVRRVKAEREPNPELRRRVLIVLAIIAVVVAMLYRPTRDLYVAWRTGYVLESRYEALAEENEELNEEIESLMTHEGIEDAARERGYVMPGETSVRVEGLEGIGEEEPETEEETHLPWYIHVGDFIFHYSGDA